MSILFESLYVNLRKLEIEDYAAFKEWVVSESFKENISNWMVTEAGGSVCTEQLFQTCLNANSNDFNPEKYLAVETKEKKSVIGLFSIKNIDWKNSTVEYNYYIHSERHRNLMFGSDISIAAIFYLFEILNFRKITGYTYEENRAASRLNEFASELEGRLEKHVKTSEGYKNVLVYGLRRECYEIFKKRERCRVLRRYYRKNIIS